MKTIGELREERLRAHINQASVAAMMGTTQSAVSRAERDGNPTQDFLQRYENSLRSIITGDTGISNSAAAQPLLGQAPTDNPGLSHDSTLEIVTLRLIISQLVERYDIADMYVFGSVARGEARPDSDVDLLYRLKPGASHSMMTMQRLTDDLESMTGRKVSLTSYDSLLRNAQRSRASQRFLEYIAKDMIKVA
ncbi:nucleotidyltransferase domain-containing protein [Bifidobacterium miconisargentati]|uniref:nucleotidyltransferase domain-containing protein n=1 Tax=Bifidobacterium miconisargentati TaxID=2834437 RepID=UPI001BDCDB0C|nr:nucleotidyltransferase domain-containing protein [Bifidobacterium miconisargentati]MBW3090264.1 nucleotidyltransferase domain-containing protein [Bifidobacterium miconisargentati]